SGAAVTGVALVGGNTYTVTVSTGTGDGNLRLVANSLNLVDAGYNAVATPAFSSLITIDKTAPVVSSVVVGDGTAQRSRVEQLRVVFSEVVSYVGAPTAAFALEKIVGGVPSGTVGISVSTVTVGGHSEATITFISDTAFGSLNDGRYRLTVLASQVRDAAGNAPAADSVTNFHRYFGDSNGDARVDVADLGPFASTYLKTSADPGYLGYFDFNNDGRVDVTDL